MSAICGLINFDGAPVEPALLRQMAEAATRHGPDGIRYWIDGNVGVAHLAFNTTPESLREQQPLLSADGMLCLVADARVDNRPELIASLSGKGYGVSENSTDADLILAAFQNWGEACPVHIIGDFAFAIWDKRKQQLFCARDVFGIKPLVYCKLGKTVCFASLAGQMLEHPKLPCRLDEIMIARFLAANFEEETHTFFEKINSIPLGHSLLVHPDRLAIQKYWEITPQRELLYKNEQEYADHFGELFQRAVGDRLRSISPVIGIPLSGGLDSSSVATVANNILKKKLTNKLSAFTIIYDRIKPVDERTYSKIVTGALNINLTYIPNDDISFFVNGRVPDIESPYRLWELTEEKIINQLHNQGGQILLTGVGGDNVVLGSPLYYADQLKHGDLSAFGRLWQDARLNNYSLFYILFMWFIKPKIPSFIWRLKQPNSEQPDTLLPSWIQSEFAKRTELRKRIQENMPYEFDSWAKLANFKSIAFLGTSFQMTNQWLNRLAVHKCVEYRHPFFDRRLIEFMLRVPPKQLWQKGLSKYLLRQSLAGKLPEPIRLRVDKTYYSDVFHYCLRVKDAGHISRLLKDPITAKLGFVDKQEIQRVYHAYLNSQLGAQTAYNLMQLVNLEYWLSHHHKFLN